MAANKKSLSKAIGSASLSHFSFENTVTLLVGEDEQKMIAYGSQLARDSEFFAAALKKEWAEGQTRTIKLPEESTAVMSHYLSYVYSMKLFTEDVTSIPAPDPDHQLEKCFELLASLYTCGERFLNRRIQQAVVTETIRFTRIPDENGERWFPGWEPVNIIYGGTPEGSPGRRLMVDLHVLMGDDEFALARSDLNASFVTDVIRSIFKIIKGLPFRGNGAPELKAEDYYGDGKQ